MSLAEGPTSPAQTRLDRRTRWILAAAMVLLVVVSAQRYLSRPARPTVEFQGATMGTTWFVKIATTGLGRAAESALTDRIAARLERVDSLMSTWRADSELSRFNRHRARIPFPVAPETLAVFVVAQDVSEWSGGAFDVTVGPLVDAWGFGAGGTSTGGPPSEQTIAELRTRIGYQKLTIDVPSSALAKTIDAIACDLSAVAKGFAVDEVARSLVEDGQLNFLVEIGGELRARGTHLDGSPWRVAIEAPESERRVVHRVVELRDLAMATSGDYRNYYEENGRRISHTIDPRTGRPIEHRLASVTVFTRDAARADALATALNVLGPEDGYRLANQRGIAAYFIVRERDGSYRTMVTGGFEKLFPNPAEL